MKWDEHETQTIVKLLADLWPNAKPYTDAQLWNLQRKMMGSARTAQEAIADVAAESTHPARPGQGAFIAKAKELTLNKNPEAKNVEVCPWCGNMRFVVAHVWAVSGEELIRLDVPEDKYLPQRNGPLFCVEPDFAVAMQLGPTEVHLRCGRCGWFNWLMSVRDFHSYYKTFWCCATDRDKEVADACLQDEPPEAPELMTLQEYLAKEQVDEALVAMIEKARGAGRKKRKQECRR